MREIKTDFYIFIDFPRKASRNWKSKSEKIPWHLVGYLKDIIYY